MESVEKRVSKSVLYQFLSFAITGIIGIIFIPFIIERLGKEQYGLFEMVFSLNLINSVLDIGIGSTIVNYTNKYFKVGLKQFNDFFWTFFWFKFLLSILGFLLCLIVAFNTNYIFSKISIENAQTLKFSIIWFGIGVIIQNINSFFTGLQNGFVRFDLSSHAAIISKIFYIILFFLWWYTFESPNIIEFCIITFVGVPLIKLIIHFFQLKYFLPVRNLIPVWIHWNYIRTTLEYLRGISIVTIFAQLFTYGAQAILSILALPEVVAEFGILKRILMLVQSISNMLIRPLLPAANSLREKYNVQKIILIGTRAQSLVVITLTLFILINAKFISKYYLNDQFSNFEFHLGILSLQLLLPSFVVMLMIYYNEGNVKMSVNNNILNTIISLSLSYIGFLYFNFLGFILGLSIGYILVMFFQTLRFLKYFKVKPILFFKIYLQQYLVFVVCYIIYLLIKLNLGLNYKSLIIWNLSTLLLSGIMSWYFLDIEIKKRLKIKFSKIYTSFNK